MIGFAYLRMLLKNIFNSITSCIIKGRTLLKNILDTQILRNLVTSHNIFYLPTFLLKYSEQEFS